MILDLARFLSQAFSAADSVTRALMLWGPSSGFPNPWMNTLAALGALALLAVAAGVAVGSLSSLLVASLVLYLLLTDVFGVAIELNNPA